MIIITQLSKSYNNVMALNNVSLCISDNTIFGLLGPNGAGKSTLLNLILGFIKPSYGKIDISVPEQINNRFKVKDRMGIVSEILPIFEGLTGVEQLRFVGRIFEMNEKLIKNRTDELFDYFNFNNARDQLISTYSQGMKRKIAFSSAIIHDPELLILDEPFENVDPVSRKKMKDTLKKIKNKGGTILITSHVLSEIEEYCDRVAIINKGKIVYQSETKDIRNKIKNEVTKETYQSLEEIFIDLTKDKEEDDIMLSWL